MCQENIILKIHLIGIATFKKIDHRISDIKKCTHLPKSTTFTSMILENPSFQTGFSSGEQNVMVTLENMT